MLEDFGGKPLVLWAVEHALQACTRAIVVLGHNADSVQRVLPALPGLRTVRNPRYEKGMLTSVARGAQEVRTRAFFVAPADMPFLRPESFLRLARTAGFLEADDEAVPPGPVVAWIPDVAGQRGHPVLIRASVIPALVREAAKESPLGAMHRFLSPHETLTVPIEDDGSIVDIDTMTELERFAPRDGKSDG